MTSLNVVSLDLFETLVHFDSQRFDSRSTLENALQMHSEVPEIPFEKVYSSYYQTVSSHLRDYENEKEFSNDEILLGIWENNNISRTPELEKTAFDVMTSYFSDVSNLIQPFSGVYDTLQFLLDQGMQLVLVSNHSWSQNGWEIIELLDFKDYFRKIVFSSDVGYKKPSSKIFDVIRETFPDYNNGEFVHIGDDIQADVYGALKYGIKAVWIKNPKYLDLEIVIRDHQNYLGAINSIQDAPTLLAKLFI